MTDISFNIQSPEEYRKLFNRAEQLYHDTKIPEALAAYTSLLQYRLEWEEREPGLPFSINEFFIVDRLADLALLAGNKTAVQHLLTALVAITKSAGNIGMLLHAVTKLILVNLQAGNFDGAMDNALSISAVIGDINKIQVSAPGLVTWENNIQFDPRSSEQDQADQLVCLYDALGALLLALGRFADAILLFQRGIQIGDQNHSPVVDSRFLPMHILRAKAFFQKGEVESAIQLLKAIEKDTGLANAGPAMQIHLLDLRSRMALAQGELGDAYNFLDEIIRLCRVHRLPLAEILANFNLAMTKVRLNQVSEAADILQDCLVRAERLGETGLASRIKRFLHVADNRMQAAIPSINYLNSRQGMKQQPVAETGMDDDNARHSEDYLSFFDEKALLFQLFLAENNFVKAGEALAQLKLLISKCDSALIHYRFSILSFMQLYFTNAVIPPDFPFKKILHFFSANQLLPELWQFRYLLGHTNLVPENEKASWVEDNQRMLDYITSSLPPAMQTLFLLNKWSPNEEYLASFSNQLLQKKQAAEHLKFPLSRWFKRWGLMKKLYLFQEELKRFKDQLSRKALKTANAGDFLFQTSQKGMLGKLWSHPKRSLSVSFLVLPDRIVIISRSFLKIRLHITFINRAMLRQMVFSLRDCYYPEGKSREIGLSSPAASPAADANKILQNLEKILQLENILADHQRDIHHISFHPDDALHAFPFALLTLNGSRLLSKMRVSISIDDLKQQQKLIPFFKKKILLTGVSKTVLGLPELPGVLQEVAEINKKLKEEGAEVNILLDRDATVIQVKEQLQQVDAAHFSCHGKFDFKQPDQSGLVLAGGEMLTLKDILSMKNLSGIRLLVLSSCRGAEHFVLPGRWIIGLPETFCRAGVQAVLGFLWPVDDQFATVFASRFYEHLKNNIPAESFRLTLLDAQHKELPGLNFEYWDPKFWAGATFYER